jgi:AraC family transcriptional regulator
LDKIRLLLSNSLYISSKSWSEPTCGVSEWERFGVHRRDLDRRAAARSAGTDLNMSNSSCRQAAIDANEWVQYLGGEAVLQGPSGCAALTMGQYRFPERPERFTAPPLARHYLSITLDGPTQVERDLHGDRETAKFAPGTSLIMSADQPNSWRWDRPTEEIHFYLCPDFLRRIGEAANVTDIALIERFAFADERLQQLASTLVEEIRSPGVATDLWTESVTNVLYMHILRHYCESRNTLEQPQTGLTAAQLRHVEEFATENLDQEVTLTQMAEVAGVSRFHFAHMFKRSVGTPPHQWLMARRIERAKELLVTTNRSITEIAFDVGYQSQSHFGHVFRRATGVTPRQWRTTAPA